MKTRLLLLALALPLAACGNDEADTTTVTEAPSTATTGSNPGTMPGSATDPMATSPVADDVTVDGTIQALGTDVTRMSIPAATANIDGWIAKLEGEQFAEIRSTLERLKRDLAAQPIDGAAVGATLTSLGEQTTASAATASSSSQDGLRTLGGALSAAGARLSGSAR